MIHKLYKYAITGFFLVVVFSAYLYVEAPQFMGKEEFGTALPRATAIVLTPVTETHILHGNSSGGGHLHGAGKPCKSEFPADWNAQKIIDTTRRIAANDNLDWRQEDNGYYVTEQMVDGVNVRVVLGKQKARVVTSYPVNLPRNPCPANDNRP